MSTEIFTKDERHYIDLLQSNIHRMAMNSANCKAWLIALVTAALAFSEVVLLKNIWVLLIPTLLFYFLDCYYLGLERRFILIENEFLKKIREHESVESSIYSFNIRQFGCDLKWVAKAMNSWSTTPFYCLIALSIIIYTLVV